MKIRTFLSIILGGYLSSLGFYFSWYWTKWPYSFNEVRYSNTYLLEISAVVFVITLIYFFCFLLILYTRSLQKFWTTLFLISIITLLTFFLIPSSYYAIYYFERAKEKIRIEEANEKVRTTYKLAKEIGDKLNEANKQNIFYEKYIADLQGRLKSEREENVKLKKQLNEITRKTESLEEERKTKEDIVAHSKSNKNISKIKINSKMANTESDTINQEIIFKVQVISSSTRLVKNSPQFNGLKNIWEYKDSGIYKYTVGNEKDLKSASALQSELRKKGFNGAFVVAFKNGKRIPVREARNLLN